MSPKVESLVHILADPDDVIADEAGRALSNMLAYFKEERALVIERAAALDGKARARAYRALQGIDPGESVLLNLAVSDVQGNDDPGLLAAAMSLLQLVASTDATVRSAIIGRTQDPRAHVVRDAIGALSQATHLSDVKDALDRVAEGTGEQPTRTAALQVAYSSQSIQQMLAAQSNHEPSETRTPVSISSDTVQRTSSRAIRIASLNHVEEIAGEVLTTSVDADERAFAEIALKAIERLREYVDIPEPDARRAAWVNVTKALADFLPTTLQRAGRLIDALRRLHHAYED